MIYVCYQFKYAGYISLTLLYNNQPCGNWNGWCDDTIPTNTSFQPCFEMRAVPLDMSNAIASLSAKMEDVMAQTREISNSLKIVKKLLIALTVVLVLLVLCKKVD